MDMGMAAEEITQMKTITLIITQLPEQKVQHNPNCEKLFRVNELRMND